MRDERENPLRPIVTGWLSKIDIARERKKRDFQDVADECQAFFYDKDGFMWDPGYRFRITSRKQAPRFKMTINKAFEFVALYGPMLYHRNPYRQVRPRDLIQFPPELYGVDPNYHPPQQPPQQPGQPPTPPPAPTQQDLAQQQAQAAYQQAMSQENQASQEDGVRAALLEAYLNYTPGEMPGGGFRGHAERAITESLVKGGGLLWSMPYTPPGANHLLIVSEYDSIDNLLIDPDATSLEDALWVARKCVHPYWQVEREYGLEPGSLKGRGGEESLNQQAHLNSQDSDGKHERKQGKTNDLMTYYKVWSKMGVGSRLSGVKFDGDKSLDDMVGDYAFLVVAPDVPYPLNLPNETLDAVGAGQADESMIHQSLDWPIPYYADDRWPFTLIAYYFKDGCPYPIPPLAPGLGELKFINTMVSHLCNRIWSSCRDFVGVAKADAEKLKEVLENGGDQAVIELETATGMKINELVQFIQQPQTNLDAWKILESVMELFERRVGLSDLMYGMSPVQMRSATEAQTKGNKVDIRPDYMAGKVEESLTECSRREAFCARWYLTPEDIALSMGQQAAIMWGRYVMSSDIERVVREFEYHIEESSARKPNLDRDAANAQQAMQQLLPIYAQYGAQTGNYAPFNALVQNWGKTVFFKTDQMMLSPPPPPPPGSTPQEQSQMELQAKQQEMQIDGQRGQQDLMQRQQLNAIDLQGARQKLITNALSAKIKLAAQLGQRNGKKIA